MKSRWILVALALMVATLALGQTDSAQVAASKGQQTIDFAKMLNECEIFKWPLVATLFFGLVISIYQFSLLLMETRRSQPLYLADFAETRLNAIEKMLQGKPGLSKMGQLLQMMTTKFRRGDDLEGMYHSEVAHQINVRRDRFGTYRTWTLFFSDAAGALGLLGTVQGMYVTFSGGIMNSNKILNGMSLALATTIVGLINSLILTLVLTSITHFFDRQIEKTHEKAEELRDLMKVRNSGELDTERGIAA